jgi:hypothetical protein
MVASGWKELSGHWKASNIDLRLEKDNRRIHIFQVRPRRPFSGVMVVTGQAESAPTHLFGISDTQSFSDDERRVALDGLLTEPYSLEHLMLFERMFDKSQQDRWLEVLESLPVRDVFAQIRLGELYQRRDLPEKATEALRLARALLWAERDQSKHQGRLKNLAKQLGDEKLAEVVPTRQDFLDAGFVEIARGTDAFEMEAGAGEPTLMFHESAEDGPVVLVVEIIGSGSDNDPYQLRHLERQKGMSSYSTRGGFSQRNGLWHMASSRSINDMSVAFQITQIEGTERFKVSTTLTQR